MNFKPTEEHLMFRETVRERAGIALPIHASAVMACVAILLSRRGKEEMAK